MTPAPLAAEIGPWTGAIDGVRVGHWTDSVALTGCTVVLLPAGAVASGEVRGGAPGTREWALLSPTCTVDGVNAVVLTGGSAFGLAACEGVVRWCEERGIGYPTPAAAVPIVVGMVVYDLGVGDPSVRPGPEEGYAACHDAAASGALRAAADGAAALTGRIGAGTGATVAKWGARTDGTGLGLGLGPGRPGGLGSAQVVASPGSESTAGSESAGSEAGGRLVVAAVVVVNAMGDLWDPAAPLPAQPRWTGAAGAPAGLATTIGVVATNAVLTKTQCLLVAQSAHDGLARAIDPVHTGADGDAFVAAATGALEAPIDWVRALAARATEAAVRDALSGDPAGRRATRGA